MRARFCLLFLAAAALPANADTLSALDDPSLMGKNRYERCLELLKRDPSLALNQADGWWGDHGGAAALHCSALALVALKRYVEAGARLEQAAREAATQAPGMRPELLDQAGNAWLLAGQSEKADGAFSAALALTPQDEDILADRARARGESKNWRGAEADLSAVLSLDPDRADALVLRASARHAQGDSVGARADLEHALAIYPGYPEGLLERGTLKFESGDLAGARADWQRTLQEAPDSAAAQAAHTRLDVLASHPRPAKQ